MQPVPDSMSPACRRIVALAERSPRRAVALARRACDASQADGSLSRAWAHYTLGWALLCRERFDAARTELQAAHERFATLEVSPGLLRCRYGLLLADARQSAHADQLAAFEGLVAQLLRVNLPNEAAQARLDQARLLNVLGRPQDAKIILDQVEPILTQSSPSDLARLLRVRGVAAYLTGEFLSAIELLEKAEEIFISLGNRLETAKCWFEQAVVALRQERLDQALAQYRRAEHVFATCDLPLQRAFCTKDIGIALMMRGAYDRALRHTLQAQQQFTALDRTKDVGMTYLHIGNIYFYVGHWEAAAGAYSRAEMLCDATGVVGYAAIARRNRAMVCRVQGRLSDARALLDDVEAHAHTLGNQAELAAIWEIKGALLADEDQFDDARTYYQRAQMLFLQLGNQPAAATSEMELAWLDVRRGAWDEAYEQFVKVRLLLEEQPYRLWRVEHGLARCAELHGDMPAALGHYRAASATIAALRGRLRSELISSSLFAQAAQLHVDALQLAARLGDGAAVLELSEEQRALALQHALVNEQPLSPAYAAQHDALRQYISVLLDAQSSERDQVALDEALTAYGDLLLHARHSMADAIETDDDALPLFNLENIRAKLAERYATEWTALVYVLLDELLLMVLVTPTSITVAQMAFDPDLRRLVVRASSPTHRHCVYRDLAFAQGRADQPWAELVTLGARLLPPPVRERLHPQHRLLIVPAGPLHALPWAALRVDDRWLTECAVIQIAPSLSVWQSLAARPPTGGTEAFLIGCSDFGERAPALPGVSDELATIAPQLPDQVDQLRDVQATRAALLERAQRDELDRYRLLHIASHARMLPTRGLAAHVKLWDGDLFLPEVAELRLDSALVVLSACDGAAADTLPGEEVLSLSWAFLAAGASSVVASLWPAYDRAMVQLMEALYANLHHGGDVAYALAQAQRGFIGMDGGESVFANPLCWGSFVVIGDARFW